MGEQGPPGHRTEVAGLGDAGMTLELEDRVAGGGVVDASQRQPGGTLLVEQPLRAQDGLAGRAGRERAPGAPSRSANPPRRCPAARCRAGMSGPPRSVGVSKRAVTSSVAPWWRSRCWSALTFTPRLPWLVCGYPDGRAAAGVAAATSSTRAPEDGDKATETCAHDGGLHGATAYPATPQRANSAAVGGSAPARACRCTRRPGWHASSRRGVPRPTRPPLDHDPTRSRSRGTRRRMRRRRRPYPRRRSSAGRRWSGRGPSRCGRARRHRSTARPPAPASSRSADRRVGASCPGRRNARSSPLTLSTSVRREEAVHARDVGLPIAGRGRTTVRDRASRRVVGRVARRAPPSPRPAAPARGRACRRGSR